MGNIESLVPLLVPLVTLVVFIVLVSVFYSKTRLKRTLDVDTGPPLRESGWGSANVNGIGINNAVKLAEHPTGWLVQAMWIIGGGKLWLPKDELRVGGHEAGTFLRPHSRTLRTGEHTIRLYGRLADFFAESLSEHGA
jgi:hypothetical protein